MSAKGALAAIILLLFFYYYATGAIPQVGTSSGSSSGFVFGVAGLSGTDYPSSFISSVTGQYKITAFRMDRDLFTGSAGDQLPKYVSNGAKVIYLTYGGSQTDNPTAWAQGLVSLVQANPQITYIGLMNEPNLNGWSPQQYVVFLQAAYKALKGAGIHQPLCAFETSGDGDSADQTWIQQAINDGGRGYYDMACIHVYVPQTYSTFSSEVSIISSNLDQVHSIVGTTMMITETSITGGTGNYVGNNPAGDMQTLYTMYESKSYMHGAWWYPLLGSTYSLFKSSYSPTALGIEYSSLIAQ